MVVVLFPSPRGVGVIPVTTTYLSEEGGGGETVRENANTVQVVIIISTKLHVCVSLSDKIHRYSTFAKCASLCVYVWKGFNEQSVNY